MPGNQPVIQESRKNSIPRFIYFTGVDGSGKSTYVNMLIKEFERRGMKAKRVWLRFNYFFTKPVLLYCRLVGLTRRPVRGGRKISVHDFYRCPPIGKLVQYLHFLDTCIHYFFEVYLPLRFGRTYIFCDRFVCDLLADYMIENRDFHLPNKLIGKLLFRLLPRNALVLYFKVNKQEIIRRKPEVLFDDEDYAFKYDTYAVLEKYIKGDFLNNNGDVSTVFRQIMDLVFHQKQTHRMLANFSVTHNYESSNTSFSISSIPCCLRWLFPYKQKPLPISTQAPILYYMLQNKVSLVLINWLFQGMRGMGFTDLIGKICLEFVFFSMALICVNGTGAFPIVVALFIARTLNWFLNSHFWVMGRYLGITRSDPGRFPEYLKKVMDRLQKCSSIDAVIVIGGASRKQGVKETSDIDIFFIRRPGLINGVSAVRVTVRERILAFFQKFPLHLELYDTIQMMDRHRKDETPFVLKDVLGRATAYYTRQEREIAGFDEYEREAQKTA